MSEKLSRRQFLQLGGLAATTPVVNLLERKSEIVPKNEDPILLGEGVAKMNLLPDSEYEVFAVSRDEGHGFIKQAFSAENSTESSYKTLIDGLYAPSVLESFEKRPLTRYKTTRDQKDNPRDSEKIEAEIARYVRNLDLNIHHIRFDNSKYRVFGKDRLIALLSIRDTEDKMGQEIKKAWPYFVLSLEGENVGKVDIGDTRDNGIDEEWTIEKLAERITNANFLSPQDTREVVLMPRHLRSAFLEQANHGLENTQAINNVWQKESNHDEKYWQVEGISPFSTPLIENRDIKNTLTFPITAGAVGRIDGISEGKGDIYALVNIGANATGEMTANMPDYLRTPPPPGRVWVNLNDLVLKPQSTYPTEEVVYNPVINEDKSSNNDWQIIPYSIMTILGVTALAHLLGNPRQLARELKNSRTFRKR